MEESQKKKTDGFRGGIHDEFWIHGPQNWDKKDSMT